MLKDFTKEKFDIIIQAGQSNSVGTGFGKVENPYVPNELVWYMHGDFTMYMAAELVEGNHVGGNFALSFAQDYLDKGLLQEGRKLLIIRTAVGGTGFLDHRWGMTDDLYLRMMEMTRTALALNPENRLVTFLWHQGELDAISYASYDVHYHHLMNMLQSVREEFHVPDLPFVAGDFVQQWKSENIEMCVPVLNAIRAVCRDCGYGSFVETDGLLSNMEEIGGDHPYGWDGDSIHFSRKSLYILGKRYFDAFLLARKEIDKEK